MSKPPADEEPVRFGCISCKRTKRTEALDAAAEKTMEAAFHNAFNFLQAEGARLGVDVPEALEVKMMKWGRKYSIFPPAPESVEDLINQRNRLD